MADVRVSAKVSALKGAVEANFPKIVLAARTEGPIVQKALKDMGDAATAFVNTQSNLSGKSAACAAAAGQMHSLNELTDLLVKALREPMTRKAVISCFQKSIWEGRDPRIRSEVFDVLRELAYDLDFFEVDPNVRNEDPSYYGHKRAEAEIRAALRKLKEAGVELPGELDLGAAG